MIKQAKNGYEVQISEISKKQYTVSRNKEGEHGFVYHNEQSAIDKFNELLNEKWYGWRNTKPNKLIQGW